jgi:hypothetical protein
MDATFWNSLIDQVERQVENHFDSLLVVRWARIAADNGSMNAERYFAFKTKLGMGY